jgi:ribosomal protein S25
MKNKDLNYIAALEKAIKKKYGEEAIQNPASSWDEEKEKDYLLQLEEFITKQRKYELATRPENVDGFLITKKLLSKERKINCSVCFNLLRKINDEIYMLKYDCCETCFIRHVEGRHERWLKGWRPKNVTKSS